jgi:hypothetical protein
MLARRGKSLQVIETETGLSRGRLGYRFREWGVKISDARNCLTPETRRELESCRRLILRCNKLLKPPKEYL